MAPRPSESIMTSASTMSGGEAVVRSLIANGIDTIFGLPGVQLDHFFNALHDHGNELRVLNARHEQGTAYMAFGWAQSTGRSEEHTSELQSLMRISYAVFCLKNKKKNDS